MCMRPRLCHFQEMHRGPRDHARIPHSQLDSVAPMQLNRVKSRERSLRLSKEVQVLLLWAGIHYFIEIAISWRSWRLIVHCRQSMLAANMQMLVGWRTLVHVTRMAGVSQEIVQAGC